MAKDSITTSRKVKGQSVTSDVTSIDQALSQVRKTDGARSPRSKILAQNNPATQKGYTRLGPGGPPHTGKAYPPKSKDNRGEGSA